MKRDQKRVTLKLLSNFFQVVIIIARFTSSDEQGREREGGKNKTGRKMICEREFRSRE